MNLRKKIKGLLTEAPTGVFHEWKECGNSSGPSVNWDGIGFWVNGPGWNVGTQTGGSPTYPWATHQNSAAFWTFLQQPQQGTIVGFETNNSAGNTVHICLEYMGTTQTIDVAGGGTFNFGGGNQLTNVTSYSGGEGGCKECLGSQQQHACIGSYCVVDPNGPYSSLSDCQDCLADPQCPCDNVMWKCEKQVSWEAPLPDQYKCVSTVDGSGQYTNLQDCEDNCDTTAHILTPTYPVPPKEPVLWNGEKDKTIKERIQEELENYDDTVTQVQFQDELIQLSSQERDMVRDILEDSLGEKRELEEAFDYKGIPELKAKGFFGKMMKYFKRLFTDKATSFLINASATETKDTIELIKVMDPNDMTGVFDPRAIYLGGAIDFATDALGWRTKMEEYFGESHVVKDERMAKLVLTGEWDTKGINTPAILNPMRAETVREEDEEFTDLFGKWKKDSLTDDEMQGFREKIRQNIILQDLRMLDICDTNLVRYDGKAGAGTLGEAQISALKNQQIFLWVTDGMKISNVSPWLLPAVTKICIDDEIWELLKHFR